MSKKDRKKKQYDDNNDDDGRSITNMNVDGMPWYTGRHEENTARNKDKTVSEENKEKITLTKKEEFALMRGVVLAALLAGAIFFGAFALFILFCIYVWFK